MTRFQQFGRIFRPNSHLPFQDLNKCQQVTFCYTTKCLQTWVGWFHDVINMTRFQQFGRIFRPNSHLPFQDLNKCQQVVLYYETHSIQHYIWMVRLYVIQRARQLFRLTLLHEQSRWIYIHWISYLVLYSILASYFEEIVMKRRTSIVSWSRSTCLVLNISSWMKHETFFTTTLLFLALPFIKRWGSWKRIWPRNGPRTMGLE